jgi:hypothetical protein
MCTVVPDIYNVFTAPHIWASIFSCRYLRWYWRYLENSMRPILQTWWQIQRTSSSLRYANCGPGHIQCIYSSAYSGHNIQLNISALQLEICRYLDARYTTNWGPYVALSIQFTLCKRWSRLYTKYLQLRIFRLQYSTQCIYAAIGDISTIRCSLY